MFPDLRQPVSTDVCSDGMRPRSAYVLAPQDVVRVAAYRMRRWGVAHPVGELVEVQEAPRGRAA